MPRVSKKGKHGRPSTIAIGSQVKVRAVRGPDDRGRWYWQATAYDPATRKRPTVWSGWASAERVEREVLAIVAERPTAIPTARPEADDIRTVLDLMEAWTAEQEARLDLSENSKRVYRTAARHIVGAPIARRSVKRLARIDLQRHRDHRLSEGAAGRTVHSELRVLRSAWRWYLDLSGLPAMTIPSVRVVQSPVRNRYTPSAPEVLAVLEQLRGWSRTAVAVLFATGARPGEVRDLTWEQVNFSRRTAVLDGKTGPRTVPLSPDILRILREARPEDAEPTDRVLTCTKRTFGALGARYLDPACERAGVPRFTPYGLRRAAVDAMARAGVDIGTAAAITGHSPEVMLRHYRGVSESDKRRGIEKARLGVIPAGEVVQLHTRSEAG